MPPTGVGVARCRSVHRWRLRRYPPWSAWGASGEIATSKDWTTRAHCGDHCDVESKLALPQMHTDKDVQEGKDGIGMFGLVGAGRDQKQVKSEGTFRAGVWAKEC